jgi:hypothetical protein
MMSSNKASRSSQYQHSRSSLSSAAHKSNTDASSQSSRTDSMLSNLRPTQFQRFVGRMPRAQVSFCSIVSRVSYKKTTERTPSCKICKSGTVRRHVSAYAREGRCMLRTASGKTHTRRTWNIRSLYESSPTANRYSARFCPGHLLRCRELSS